MLQKFRSIATPSPSTPFSSETYWQHRHGSDRNSGAGSLGRSADYKAEIVNGLVARRKIGSVIEFGFGDGNQASRFDVPSYTGLDVSRDAVARARKKAGRDKRKIFHTLQDFTARPREFDLSLSLDVIDHLVEETVFSTYMERLFAAADRYVLICASDTDKATGAVHMRHCKYSAWITDHALAFRPAETWPHPDTYSGRSVPTETGFAFFRLFERRAQ